MLYFSEPWTEDFFYEGIRHHRWKSIMRWVKCIAGKGGNSMTVRGCCLFTHSLTFHHFSSFCSGCSLSMTMARAFSHEGPEYLVVVYLHIHKSCFLAPLFHPGKFFQYLYGFPMAIVTNHYKLGFIQHEVIILWVWRPEVQTLFHWTKVKVLAGLIPSRGYRSNRFHLFDFPASQCQLLS